MMCDEKEYNPQGGSLLACIVTQGRLRCTCQPCAIESITPMGYGHTVWFGAIECTMGNGTPRGLVAMGRGGACVPARVALQGRIHRSFPAHNACIFCMETPLRGRSGGHIGTAPTILFERIVRGCSPLRFRLGGLCVGVRPLRFRLGRLRVDGWRRLGGLRVSVEWRLDGLCMMLGHVV